MAEHLSQEQAGVRVGGCRDFLGRALGHDLAASVAALWPEIDDMVGGLDHVEVVLDHDDGVAGVGEAPEHFEQAFDVVEVKPGGRLV